MNFDVEKWIEELADRIVAKLRNHGGSHNGPRLLSIEDAAAYIGRTKPGLGHLIAAGKIPTVRADRRVQIDVRDLDEWIEKNKTT